MGDLLKSIVKLEVSGDGRAAENYNSYKVQLENALSAKEMQGVYLDDVLLNIGEGVECSAPGADSATWIALAPPTETRTAELFAAAQTKHSKWSRANRVTHSYIMATLPPVLHEECAQRAKAHELWAYLEQRFAAQTLASVAAMWVRLLQLRLDDFCGVSAFLTAITKLELEIKRGGVEVPDTLLAGSILNGMGDRYPTTKELMLTLPIAQQTKHYFGERLLEAEKNAKISADMAFAGSTHAANASSTFKTGGCGYVRQHQGKGGNAKPGSKCIRGVHKRNDCWALLDDKFLSANPGKGPGDLPNRLADLRAKQAQAKMAKVDASVANSCVDLNVADVNLSGLSLEYTALVGKAETAAHAQPGAHKKSNASGREVTVALDSAATTSCWKEKVKHQPLSKPVRVNGASADMISLAHGTSILPCPALPEKELKGIYSSEFRHNLVALKELQKRGVEVAFPAHKTCAECRNPSTGEVLWTFEEGESGLYEATIQLPPSDTFAGATTTACQCHAHSLQHPTILLHYRLGHMSESYIQTLIKAGSIQGLPKAYTHVPKELHTSCLPCIEAKSQAKAHPLNRTRAKQPLAKVHVDLVGPLPGSLKGERYRLTIVDDFSRFGWTVLLHTKDQAKVRIIEWMALVEKQTEHKVKHVHGDRGGEFLNNILLGHLQSVGVKYTFSNPDSPQQNGVAEARNKCTGRILRSLLLQSEAPKSLWGYAVLHATHLNNLFPHALLEGQTPFEVWHKEKPSMRRLKVWGCTGHVLMNKQERRSQGGKLGPVTKPCVLVGINPHGPGWIFLDGETNRELPSSDVVFQEDTSFYRRRIDRAEETAIDWFAFDETTPSTSQQAGAGAGAGTGAGTGGASSTAGAGAGTSTGAGGALPKADATDSSDSLDSPPSSNGSGDAEPPVGDFQAQVHGESQQGSESTSEPRRSRRLQGLAPQNLPPSNLRWNPLENLPPPDELPGHVHALVQTIAEGESGDKKKDIPIPPHWQEALEGEYGPEWAESMLREYQGLLNTGTLQAFPRNQARNVVKCKWIFRIKRRKDGSPHFKSRIVAKGCTQKPGVDFFETWAPTARQTTARAFLHLAAAQDMEVHAMDVDQAFLQGDLEEEIFMEAPPGIGQDPGKDNVWRLKRPLYGLKQAPRQWQAKLKAVLLQLGFQPSHSDPSLYIGQSAAGTWVLVYVDDLLLAAQQGKDLAILKQQLQEHFPMKDLGEVSAYLGMEVTRDRANRRIYLSQERYVGELVAKFNQENSKSVTTPLQVNHGLCLPLEGEETVLDQERFPELLGGIMYLMVCTRPDIAHAVSVLSRFIAPGRHGAKHWNAALRLLAYLKETAGHALCLGGETITLEGHSDSSWADDQMDRKSSQGYSFNLGSGAISWRATRSPAVALSSTEAELYAGTSASQEAVWLQGLLQEFGHRQRLPTLWCDNQSTIAMTKDPIFSARSKHIEARYFFIRELVQAGKLQVLHVKGTENVADIFTKPLSAEDHHRLMAILGVLPKPTAAACLPGGVLQNEVEVIPG